MKIIKKILVFSFLLFFFLFPIVVSAQFTADLSNSISGKLSSAGNPTGLTSDLTPSVTKIINGILSLVGTIFLILIIYAGILWMTASGNEEKVTSAKSIATQAVIGLIITLGAYAITAFVTNRLTSSSTKAGSGVSCADEKGICIPQSNLGICNTEISAYAPDSACASDETCCQPKYK